ncbi:MAG: tRNA lysidine(34) synthetase TilS [Bacteroidota bacterium]
MTFIKRIEKFIRAKRLLNKQDQVVVAFSGGIDSAVLAYLLKKLDFSITLAHCNFQLREEESDADEKFANEFAALYSIPIETKRFNTQEWSEKKRISIQEAARELRYSWFEQLASKGSYSKIATGHHLDDAIETILINQYRGTGIKGLSGIPVKRRNIIRPLLMENKGDVTRFALENGLKWREDSSNRKLDYLRNQIRHLIIPELKLKSKDFYKEWKERIEHNRQLWNELNKWIELAKKSLISNDNSIDVHELLASKSPGDILFYLLEDFGFSVDQRKEALDLLGAQKGKKIIGKEFTIWREDKILKIVSNVEENFFSEHYIEKGQMHAENAFGHFKIEKSDGENIKRESNFACLDNEKIDFPLLVRRWKQGDKFVPLGMKGSKKLSDLLTDLKVPAFKKSNALVLCSGDRIVWLVGHRLAEDFKVDERTEQTLLIEWKENLEDRHLPYF